MLYTALQIVTSRKLLMRSKVVGVQKEKHKSEQERKRERKKEGERSASEAHPAVENPLQQPQTLVICLLTL